MLKLAPYRLTPNAAVASATMLNIVPHVARHKDGPHKDGPRKDGARNGAGCRDREKNLENLAMII